MALDTNQYGYLIDPLVPITDDNGTTIKDGFLRVYIAGSSTPVITYRNFDESLNEKTIELDNSGRCKYPIIVNKSLAYKVVVYDAQHSQETPIITVDKMFAIGASVTAGDGATVVTGLDGLTTKPDGFVNASVIGTDGYVALDHTLVTDDLNTDAKVTAVENDRYIPLLNDDVNDPDSKMKLGRLWQWVLGKIKSLSTTITAFRTGDVIPVDGPSGTAKMPKDSLCNLLAGYNIGFVGLVGTNMPNVKYTNGTLTIQQSLGYIISGTEAKYIANMNYSGTLGNGTYAIYFKPSDSSVEVANPSPTYFNGENKYLLLGIVRISDGDIFSLVMFGRWKLNNVEQQFEMSKYRSDVATINASIDYLYSGVENLVTATALYKDITFSLKSGQSIRYSITANSSTGFNYSVYLFRSDNTFIECPKVRKVGEEAMYVASEDFIKVRFYNNNGSDGFSAKFQVVGANQIKNEWSYKKALKPINVLILGDSYSETAGFWRNYFVNYIPQGSSIVCLAVGSASVKDKYADKVTYPYTSRPTSSANSGNLNTFACQIEKLKRLMAGVDLDPGESQIYNGTSPDVILIQGGHNDNPDATIDNYFIQYEKQVSGVYIKQKDGKPTELGSCYIKTPVSEIDQTTFAGAYRYLVDELMQLFPSAQIYATTPANLGYWSGSVAQKRYTTSEQIRMVLNLCAVECIDWNRVANISVVRDYPSGSGTYDDPYVWAQGNGEAWADTSDAMHPNSMGARKLGQLTAQRIVDGFFSFNV